MLDVWPSPDVRFVRQCERSFSPQHTHTQALIAKLTQYVTAKQCYPICSVGRGVLVSSLSSLSQLGSEKRYSFKPDTLS